MHLNLVDVFDPVLRTPCQTFNFSEPPVDPIELAKSLVKHMYEWNALGLAANQVGIPYRVFAMRGEPENFVCFNPRIIHASENDILLEEGCLSYPGLLVKIKRPQFIRVRFNMPNSDIRTESFYGLSCRTFLHELGHLNGERFIDKANRYHREQALKNWKKNS